MSQDPNQMAEQQRRLAAEAEARRVEQLRQERARREMQEDVARIMQMLAEQQLAENAAPEVENMSAVEFDAADTVTDDFATRQRSGQKKDRDNDKGGGGLTFG